MIEELHLLHHRVHLLDFVLVNTRTVPDKTRAPAQSWVRILGIRPCKTSLMRLLEALSSSEMPLPTPKSEGHTPPHMQPDPKVRNNSPKGCSHMQPAPQPCLSGYPQTMENIFRKPRGEAKKQSPITLLKTAGSVLVSCMWRKVGRRPLFFPPNSLKTCNWLWAL